MIERADAEAAAQAFDMPGEILAAERYGSGHIHDTWRVVFGDGRGERRIILQRMNTAIFKNPATLIENIERVTKHLRSKIEDARDPDRRVLRLLSTRGGVLCHVDAADRYWRAYNFIGDATSFDEVGSAEQAFQAARAFGEFLRQLGDLPGPRLHESIPDFHNTAKRFGVFERAIEADAAGRCAGAEREIAFAMQRRELTHVLDSDLPERVTHNDTKLNNVLIDDASGEGLCVIDLDTVMPGVAAFDFGDMVRTMTCSAAEDEKDLARVAMDFELFEAVLRGYLEGAADFLTVAERESLITGAKVIIFEQGMRFLTDYLAGDTYYKVSSAEQNLDRCRTQFKLLESIEAQEGAMTGLMEKLRLG